MKRFRLHRLFAVVTFISILSITMFAEVRVCNKVKIEYDNLADGSIRVINVWNDGNKRIDLSIDGEIYTVKANSSGKPNKIAKKFVRYDSPQDSGGFLWKVSPKEEKNNVDSISTANETPDGNYNSSESETNEGHTTLGQTRQINKSATKSASNYWERIECDAFFAMDSVIAYNQKVETLCRLIESSKNKQQFIIDKDVAKFLEESEKEINERKENLTSTAQEIASGTNLDSASQVSIIPLISDSLNQRLKAREDAYVRLKTAVDNVSSDNSIIPHSYREDILNYGIVGAIVLLLIILTIVAIRRKKKNKVPNPADQKVSSHDTSTDNAAIVVRRRTTSIMKKQCIDDVIDNPAYMVIDTCDFTPNSAVKKIYIKNTCIKDVYNLYAEDLRKTDNPKEDGCMVLGRWVHDESNHTYDISLEEVILPGDDAVFKEYELNFGGKIKLRIAEKLRKLRRDTNLQYDLVCWIHSHPGLGVFFSNSDVNVQMQLKHSQHPNFLIAFVVDILTSDQEMGIFTFRKDGSINSKGDITKMYSLEEMYKWALRSERSSFSHENYFNILENAKLKLPSCKGVELNNSSIIDITQIVIEPETGIVGWAIGTTVENKEGQEYVVSSVVRNAERPSTGIIGCLINMTHTSLPTIQRLIARDSVNLSFVMVYSSKQMSITTIPVINGELLSDEQFYGDVNIDDLKIWTRRKR